MSSRHVLRKAAAAWPYPRGACCRGVSRVRSVANLQRVGIHDNAPVLITSPIPCSQAGRRAPRTGSGLRPRRAGAVGCWRSLPADGALTGPGWQPMMPHRTGFCDTVQLGCRSVLVSRARVHHLGDQAGPPPGSRRESVFATGSPCRPERRASPCVNTGGRRREHLDELYANVRCCLIDDSSISARKEWLRRPRHHPLSRVAQSRRVHRLNRGEHQSQARSGQRYPADTSFTRCLHVRPGRQRPD